MTQPREAADRPDDTGGERSARAQGSGNGSLSEAEIVEAALRVVRVDGIEKLSMRRLSRELGVSPMAPYYYVADKSELLDLLVSAALSGIRIPAKSEGTWQERLRVLLDQINEKLRKHPGLGEVLMERMLRKQLDLIDAIMEVLFDAGFSARNVLAAYATMHTYLFGRSRVTNTSHELPRQLPPSLQRATEHMADLSGKYFYQFAVETMIAGLEAQLVRQEPDT